MRKWQWQTSIWNREDNYIMQYPQNTTLFMQKSVKESCILKLSFTLLAKKLKLPNLFFNNYRMANSWFLANTKITSGSNVASSSACPAVLFRMMCCTCWEWIVSAMWIHHWHQLYCLPWPPVLYHLIFFWGSKIKLFFGFI